jgi:hypothetical protein
MGLLPFTSIDDAVGAIDHINDDYTGHSTAARQLAETHFSSSTVLSRLLEQLGVAS